MWNIGADGNGVSEVKAACGGGLKAVLGDHMGPVLGGKGSTTLEKLHADTLGHVGAERWFSRRDGGASECHDLKIS
jgi:hypothetical protein